MVLVLCFTFSFLGILKDNSSFLKFLLVTIVALDIEKDFLLYSSVVDCF